jgi:hypothetical protein
MYLPGFMPPDALSQYGESLSHEYSNWHPPVMAFVWSWLNYIVKGPYLMLAMQLGLLWGSAYYMATAAQGKGWRRGVLFVFFIAPFVHNFSGCVVKDAQMALAWLLACSMLIHAYATNRRVSIAMAIATALLLLYGGWLRHNAITGLLTLCLVWGYVVFAHKRTATGILAGLALCIAIAGSGVGFDKLVVKHRQHPETMIYFHDLAAMQVLSHINAFPQEIYARPGFDTAYISSHFTPATSDNLIWNSDGKTLLERTDEEAALLKAAWLKAIAQHPGAYLHNRWQIFGRFLRVKHSDNVMQTCFRWIPANEYGFEVKEKNFPYSWYASYMEFCKGHFYMRPWFWAVVNLLLFVFIPFIQDKGYRFIYTCLCCSALFYFVVQFAVVMNDIDFRYIYWVCLASMLAVMVGLLGRKNAAKA